MFFLFPKNLPPRINSLVTLVPRKNKIQIEISETRKNAINKRDGKTPKKLLKLLEKTGQKKI